MTQTTYDPGPVPEPTQADRQKSHRMHVIAAVHAMAQWLADHPDAPVPHTVQMIARPMTGVDTDASRVDSLDRFAEGHGAHRYGLEHRYEYAKVHLGTEDSHGAECTYTLSTTRRDVP